MITYGGRSLEENEWYSEFCLQGEGATLAEKVHQAVNNAKEPATWRSEEGGLQGEAVAGAKVLRPG